MSEAHDFAIQDLLSAQIVSGTNSASGLANLMTNAQFLIQIDQQFQACVEESWLAEAARATLHACERGGLTLSILVVNDDELLRYNRIFRQQDAPTDVLSFAVHEGLTLSGEMPDALAAELDADLGDLLLAFPYACRQSERYGHSLAAELQLLVVHGTLHLLGYDHDTESRQAEMWRKQTEILSSLTGDDLTPRLTAASW